MVAHLEVARCTLRESETGNFHVALGGEVNGNLHLQQFLLSVDDSLVLSVQHQFLHEACPRESQVAGVVVGAGGEADGNAAAYKTCKE